jgi:hypothetical protein
MPHFRTRLMGIASDAVLTNQVFVSHTSDMARSPAGRSFVQAALDGIGRAGMAAVDMRYFPAREGPTVDYCRQRVRECEAYVAVVGFRYGSIVPGADYSYTEAEFREASAAGIPRLVFLLDESAPLPEGETDSDRSAVRRFRRRLSEAGLMLARFATPDGLESEVRHALAELGRGGSLAVSGLAIRHSLPSDTAAFTGRSAEVERITAAVAPGMPDGGVIAIGGMPGMGKTALAVHVAHRLRDQFPDRQLFIDLQAHTQGKEPVSPEAALAGLLRAVGVDPRHLPGDLEGRISLWRDRMAGQRAVLVLDNAASSDQVTPLLPGAEGPLVLVTSRRYLGDLPGTVVPVQLERLPPDEARIMFLRLAPRAAIQAQEVDELVRLAGYLPLAISLLARIWAKHPAWTLAHLAAETKAGLFTMVAEKASVAAAFDVSYRYLSPDRQRFFRYLGVSPGAVIDAYAAAALAGVDLPQAAAHLDGLHGEGLLAEVGYRRYGMHELLQDYARDLAGRLGDDRQSALERLLDFHQQPAASTGRRARGQTWHRPATVAPPPIAVPDLTTIARATQWLRAERVNLLACIDHGDRIVEAYALNQLGAIRQLTGTFGLRSWPAVGPRQLRGLRWSAWPGQRGRVIAGEA